MNHSALVTEIISKVLHSSGKSLPSNISESTNILKETELDSLGLAEVVMLLEAKTNKDPFANGFINFQTIGELAALYNDR